MSLDSIAISSGPNNPSNQSGSIDNAVAASAASHEKKGKGLCGAVSSAAKSLLLLSGPAALVGFVVGKEKIAAVASVVFEKLSIAHSHVIGTVLANFSAFSWGVLGAGLLNMWDGHKGFKASSKCLTEVNEKLKTLTEGSDEHQAFSKLKRLHQNNRTRSVFQGLVGVSATVVGGLALAGVLANPYALLAVGAIAGAALVGAQVHKWLQARKVKVIEESLSSLKEHQTAETPVAETSVRN